MPRSYLRRLVPVGVALAMSLTVGMFAIRPTVSAAERTLLAEQFGFQSAVLNAAPPSGKIERPVEPSLEGINSWISAVGAAVALTDIRGLGRSADICLIDPRDDSVTLRPAPGGNGPQYAPFALTPRGLRYDRTMAPMGCVPADIDEDGNVDLIVYYWGRTPIIFFNYGVAPGGVPTADTFSPVELIEPMEIWNTTALNVGDVDGSGHLSIIVGNYFPDGARVLDPTASDDPLMQMQDGMGLASNGGRNRLFLTIPTGRPHTKPALIDESAAVPDDIAQGWTLAIGLQDLTDSGLPSIYLANDFGPDHLLVNTSTPGHVRLTEVSGERDLTTPKSLVLGHDSFKGMGVTFSYTAGQRLPMIVVSNITSQYALQESNFAFVPTGVPADLLAGDLPFHDAAEELGLSRSGWSWDVKAGDFNNSGTDQLVQAVGFLRGANNRWPELQELAMGNSELLKYPWAWPKFLPGDDVSGHEANHFWARGPDGRFSDLGAQLNLSQPGPSRGIALGDVDGDGKLDLVIANQWADSEILFNRAPATAAATNLRLEVPGATGGTRAAIGAELVVRDSSNGPFGTDRRYQLYPANGHAGVSASELHVALPAGGAMATVSWTDTSGRHRADIALTPGNHVVALGSDGNAEVH